MVTELYCVIVDAKVHSLKITHLMNLIFLKRKILVVSRVASESP